MREDVEEPAWGVTVAGLARRVLGDEHPPLVLRERAAEGRAFTYRAVEGVLTIEATDGVAASVGLHTYLRRACSTAVGWDTPLPLAISEFPDAPLTRHTAEIEQTHHLCPGPHHPEHHSWPATRRGEHRLRSGRHGDAVHPTDRRTGPRPGASGRR